MVSFIVVSKDKKKREAHLKAFSAEQHVDAFDVTILEKDTSDKKTTQSIGIEDIKNLQKKLFLKPIKSKKKLIVIEEAHLLTPEAQNALLKVLEEPPEHTIIVLSSENAEALLPTIRSRCQVIGLETETMKFTDKEKAAIQIFIETLPTMSIGNRLKQAEQLAKDKDKAIKWIEKVILVARDELLYSYNQDTPTSLLTSLPAGRQGHFSLLTSFQQLHTTLKTTNINPRFAIEHTLLSL